VNMYTGKEVETLKNEKPGQQTRCNFSFGSCLPAKCGTLIHSGSRSLGYRASN
jgi:hypothetical protein